MEKLVKNSLSRFEKISFENDEITCLRRKVLVDERGHFSRLFSNEELVDLGWGFPVSQINISRTLKAGTVRGLHYQKAPFEEDKIVTCISGEVRDIIVDVRRNSKNYLKSFMLTLSEKNNLSVVIPKGFAHGFQSLTDEAILIYIHSATYKAEYEDGLNVLDPYLAIKLPLPPAEMSIRDMNFPFIKI
ncbi:MAG: dTDP-4-dehydrorhamnose 3,5-epimerase [Bacteroidota bacterium]|jgi:dTDP-4-dehydrorhamnose 3,5-epimerase